MNSIYDLDFVNNLYNLSELIHSVDHNYKYPANKCCLKTENCEINIQKDPKSIRKYSGYIKFPHFIMDIDYTDINNPSHITILDTVKKKDLIELVELFDSEKQMAKKEIQKSLINHLYEDILPDQYPELYHLLEDENNMIWMEVSKIPLSRYVFNFHINYDISFNTKTLDESVIERIKKIIEQEKSNMYLEY